MWRMEGFGSAYMAHHFQEGNVRTIVFEKPVPRYHIKYKTGNHS